MKKPNIKIKCILYLLVLKVFYYKCLMKILT